VVTRIVETTFTRIFSRRLDMTSHSVQAVRPYSVLFIGGWGRSGSTLLGNALNEIAGFEHVGELTYVWETGWDADRQCGCHRKFQECPFWTRVVSDTFGSFKIEEARSMISLRSRATSSLLVLRDILLRFRDNQPVKAYGRVLDQLYSSIARHSPNRTIVDSSKLPIQLYALLHAANATVRVVHLVRDPRASAYSWSKEVVRTDAQPGGTMRQERLGIFQSGFRWSRNNLLVELLGKRADGYLRVRYEEFVSSPEMVLREICSFAQVPYSDVVDENGVIVMNGNHAAWGNPSRSQTGPTPVRLDDAWRVRLPRKSRIAVTVVAWAMMLHYGYLRRRRR
jgi:hypothetical protein